MQEGGNPHSLTLSLTTLTLTLTLTPTMGTPFFTPPPPARPFADDKATLIVCWWCTAFALTIILFRVAGRYIRTEKLFPEDVIALCCAAPILARMALVHVVLLWGTNNVVTAGLTAQEVAQREVGSRLVLGSRVFYVVR